MSDFVIDNDYNKITLKKYTGSDDHVIIPDGVNEIGFNAFEKPIKSLEVPNSVQQIKNFCRMPNLHFAYGWKLMTQDSYRSQTHKLYYHLERTTSLFHKP